MKLAVDVLAPARVTAAPPVCVQSNVRVSLSGSLEPLPFKVTAFLVGVWSGNARAFTMGGPLTTATSTQPPLFVSSRSAIPPSGSAEAQRWWRPEVLATQVHPTVIVPPIPNEGTTASEPILGAGGIPSVSRTGASASSRSPEFLRVAFTETGLPFPTGPDGVATTSVASMLRSGRVNRMTSHCCQLSSPNHWITLDVLPVEENSSGSPGSWV